MLNSISELSNLLCLMTWPIGREIMEESIFSFGKSTFDFFELKRFLMVFFEIIFCFVFGFFKTGPVFMQQKPPRG